MAMSIATSGDAISKPALLDSSAVSRPMVSGPSSAAPLVISLRVAMPECASRSGSSLPSVLRPSLHVTSATSGVTASYCSSTSSALSLLPQKASGIHHPHPQQALQVAH
ncbi:hypothetical protein AMTR_s00097p00035470 [Amborella trichopoda]|uniref:Uncharacterized protein n=1 Tax=Amborella trichopoda TaxID=13333 RepID=W1P1D7_AMBTC|nr:hypothetical protein AMTR_s00097p00035470 [Amborella trichopoda]